MTDQRDLYAHIWKGDYARREGFLDAVNKLNREFPKEALTGIAVYHSDNPYDFLLFLHLSFNPDFKGIDEIILHAQETMQPVARLRGDITPETLLSAAMNRQLNLTTLIKGEDLVDPCRFASLATLEERGYSIMEEPKNRLFLSHQSERKSQVSKLQMLLSNSEIPTWFDAIDIDFGQSIVSEIEKGIGQSTSVIFWISPAFLESNWCKYEFEAFLHSYASSRSVTIFPLVEKGLEDKIPNALTRLKYLSVDPDTSVETIASLLVPSIQWALKNE